MTIQLVIVTKRRITDTDGLEAYNLQIVSTDERRFLFFSTASWPPALSVIKLGVIGYFHEDGVFGTT